MLATKRTRKVLNTQNVIDVCIWKIDCMLLHPCDCEIDETHPSALVAMVSCVSGKSPCSPNNPCQNGGTCHSSGGISRKYNCTCEKGWHGDTCATCESFTSQPTDNLTRLQVSC